MIYFVGINLSTGIAFPKRIVIKSPKPRPGITFKIFANRVAVPPNPFDKPSYSVFPEIYPINPPVLLLAFITFAPSSSQSDIATSPTTRPAKHPVAKAVGSFLRAFKILLSVFVNPASTLPKVSNHVNPSNSAPNVDPKGSNGKYRGIAPDAFLVSVKVLDKSGNGKIENVVEAADWIIENKTAMNIRVVNISFGTRAKVENEPAIEAGEDDYALIIAVEKMWNSGIVVVAAAGNDGPGNASVTVPGISKKIITVGAFDDKNFFSGRGPTRECIVKPEVVVTGSNIIACNNHQGRYSSKSGTSMAAPIVSGAVARLIKNNPDITPKEVKMWMKSCCKKINVPLEKQGWGVLDIRKFVTG